MKYVFFISMCLQCLFTEAQISREKLTQCRNYLATRISLEVLKELSNTTQPDLKDTYEDMKGKFTEWSISGAIDEEKYYGYANGRLKRLKDSLMRPLFQIDVNDFESYEEEEYAASALVHTALSKLNTRYSPQKEEVSKLKDSFIDEIKAYLKPQQQKEENGSVETDTDTTRGAETQIPGFFSPRRFNFSIFLLFLLVGFLYFKLFGKNIESLIRRLASSNASNEPVSGDTTNGNKGSARSDEDNEKKSDSNLDKDTGKEPSSEQASVTHNSVSAPAVKPARMAKPPEKEVFYMSFPVGNYFNPDSKTKSDEGALYIFSVQPGGREAIFKFHDSIKSSVEQALRSISRYIDPACTEQNSPSSNTRSIKTIEPGKAILEGDKWRITEKAVIRYE